MYLYEAVNELKNKHLQTSVATGIVEKFILKFFNRRTDVVQVIFKPTQPPLLPVSLWTSNLLIPNVNKAQ